jgi:glutathione synthase
VFHIKPGDENLNALLELFTQLYREPVIVQRYLPEVREGDKRIILIDGEPVPHGLARIPKAGETRGNLAAGGRGVARPLTARDREIADTIGRALAPKGLFVVGLDVIGDYLTEVNVTSPTGFVEISQQTGFDVAGAFAQALEKRAGAR